MRGIFRIPICLLLSALCGCGEPSGAISGSVTVDGAPVVLGTVAFIDSQGRAKSGVIRQGEYQVEEVPLGEVTVTLQSHDLPLEFQPPKLESAGVPSAARPAEVKIPPLYAVRETSPLRYTVAAGAQRHDLSVVTRAADR